MPWKECSVMEERMRFVLRRLDGEAMSDLCREFGISRKTGYKSFDRYQHHGLEAVSDRSRRPVRYANQLPEPIERMNVTAKEAKPLSACPLGQPQSEIWHHAGQAPLGKNGTDSSPAPQAGTLALVAGLLLVVDQHVGRALPPGVISRESQQLSIRRNHHGSV